MKITIITETIIKKNMPSNFKESLDFIIIDMDKETKIKFKSTNLIILLSKKLLNKKTSKYKYITSYCNKKNIEFIEVAFEKSKLNSQKSYAKAIIHGFEKKTFDVINKIIDNYRKN